jgi:hypothetical protein
MLCRKKEDAQQQNRTNQVRQRPDNRRRSVLTERALQGPVDYQREACEHLESELHIDRWTPAHPEYKEAVKLYAERGYRLALDRLERLVVQRLMELQKCHIRGTSE